MNDLDALAAQFGGSSKPPADDLASLAAQFGGVSKDDDSDQVSRQRGKALTEGKRPVKAEGNALTGIVDAVHNAASGMVAGPVSDVAGMSSLAANLLAEAFGAKPGAAGDPMAIKRAVQGALTAEPSTQTGERYSTSNLNPIVAAGKALHWASEKTKNAAGYDPNQGDDTMQNMVANGLGAVAEQSPAIAGAVLGKVPAVANAPANAMEAAARKKMYQAVNPNMAARESGRGIDASNFMLENGYNYSQAGREAMKAQVMKLQADLSQITNTSTKSIDKGRAIQNIYDVFDKYDNALYTREAYAQIQEVMDNFLAHPNTTGQSTMPVAAAQQMKSLIYKDNANAYRPGTAQKTQPTVDAEKALARGLKEEIARVEPQVTLLNAEESQLLNALQVTKKMTPAEGKIAENLSRSPFLLHALLTHPKLAAVVMFNKSPAFKSMMARMEFNLSKKFRDANGDYLTPGGEAAAQQANNPQLAQQLLLPSP